MDPWLESFAHANFLRSADTAHDLKTPLNVAVLNLELLRMRVRKLTGTEDPKVEAYGRAIELELRRMARIFDMFFLLSTPPNNEGEPEPIDLCPMCASAATEAGYEVDAAGRFAVKAHESRMRQALKLMFEGLGRVLKTEGRSAVLTVNGEFSLSITGHPAADDFELTKTFKFYYTDPDGNPDLSLASARLIAETYGGSLSASQDRDKVSFRLTFPPGEK